MAEFTITLDDKDVQILNQVISTSTPQVTFNEMAQFVNKINTQLTQQMQGAAQQEEARQMEPQAEQPPIKKSRGK